MGFCWEQVSTTPILKQTINTMSKPSELIKISALWKHESKDNKEYFSGKLGEARVLIFPVKNKPNEKCPDYEVFLAPPKDKGAEQPSQSST